MKAQKNVTQDLQKYIDASAKALRTLRDEIRVNAHLATMDAKDKWHQIEAQAEQAEKVASVVTEASRLALDETIAKMKDFQSWLKTEVKTIQNAKAR